MCKMAGPSHLVALFVATAGQNAENLGTDEEQIVLCVYMLYDIINNKINSVQVQYVSPKHNDIASEILLTPECKIQTGIKEEVVRAAPPLEQVIEEFERFVRTKEVHPDHGGNSFIFVCDGPLHLRMCIHAEAAKRNITLPLHFYKYYDLRKAFKSFYKLPVVNCIKDMLDFVGLEDNSSTEYGVKHCQEMASILHRLISDGYKFEEPCEIKCKLDQGICNSSDTVDDDTIVRARGLPWQSSDQDIARFFQGLNVEKGGVALCLSQQGRRNGEALVRFVDRESRDLALRKHKHHLGQRYIEVYRASGRDFLMVAGGNSSEAQTFLSRHSELGGQVIIRMRGLPYSATSEQVLNFFKNGERCEVLDKEKGLLFVHQADGRATGDAFVLFANDEEAGKALAKHRQCIGSRYIELFKSTTAEVQQVLNRSLDPRPNDHVITPYSDPLITTNLTTIINQQNMFAYPELPGMPSMAAITQAMNPGLSNALNPAALGANALTAASLPYGNALGGPPSHFNALTPNIGATAVAPAITNGINTTSSPIPGIVLPQHLITSGTLRDCIRLKGLPYEATVTDILNFLSEHSRNIVFQGVHMVYNSQGSLSGEAFIQMDSENSAELTALLKDRKFMIVNSSNKKRYIEVVQCCGQDMNMVLTNGSQTSAATNNNTSLTNPVMAGIMANTAPGVLGAAPGVLGPTPGVLGPTPGVLGPTPGVLGAPPSLIPSTPNMIAAATGVMGTPTSGVIPNPMMFPMSRPILSPAGSMMFQNQGLFPPSTPGTANMAGLIPSTSANLLAAAGAATNTLMAPNLTANITANGLLPPTAMNGQNQHIRPQFNLQPNVGGTANHTAPPGYIYWYPSPPVSPQSQPYFMQTNTNQIIQTKSSTTTATIPGSTATSVIVKGLPYLSQVSDVLTLFDGIFEIQPEIEIIRSADGRHLGEAIVTFGTRNEAERAILERNRKMVGQRSIELHMA